MSWFRRPSEVVLEAENAALRAALWRAELRAELLAIELHRVKADLVRSRSVGEAVGRTHPAGRDWCPPRGIERTWN